MTTVINFIKKYGVKLFVVVVPTVLAIWKPSSTFKSADAQAILVVGGFFTAGLIHLVEIAVENFSKYGLSKAAIEKTYDEDSLWVKQNAASLKASWATAQSALDKIPGVPGALTDLTGRVGTLESSSQSIFSKLEADVLALGARVPTVDSGTVEGLVKGFLREFFETKTASVALPAPPAPPAPPVSVPTGRSGV